MDPVTILSIFSAVMAAVWTAWTWREEHKEVRQLQRDQAAALYVNPFLFSAYQLERRLIWMLAEGDLALEGQRHPAPEGSPSHEAIETLWKFSEFFAWAGVNLRYGPYTRDPKVIELTVKIARAFDSRTRFGDTAFRFSTAEQMSLGEAVLHRVAHGTTVHVGETSSALAEFGIATLFEFERDVRDPESPRASLYQSPAVVRALAAIDRAEGPGILDGQERLAAVHRVLPSLIDHLARLEGFHLSIQDEPETPDKATTPSAASDGAAHEAAPTILHRMRGRIRVGIPRLRTDADYADRLGSLIRAWDDVDDVSVNALAGCVVVRYKTTVADDEFQTRILTAIENSSSSEDDSEVATSVGRPRRGRVSSRPRGAGASGARRARRRPARTEAVAGAS
jgi:hypothetical protein